MKCFKNQLALGICLICFLGAYSQTSFDQIHTKDGKIIRGQIIHTVYGKGVEIQASDGSRTFIYKDDIDYIRNDVTDTQLSNEAGILAMIEGIDNGWIHFQGGLMRGLNDVVIHRESGAIDHKLKPSYSVHMLAKRPMGRSHFDFLMIMGIDILDGGSSLLMPLQLGTRLHLAAPNSDKPVPFIQATGGGFMGDTPGYGLLSQDNVGPLLFGWMYDLGFGVRFLAGGTELGLSAGYNYSGLTDGAGSKMPLRTGFLRFSIGKKSR